MQKITPFLWFDNHAEDAAKFYTSVFPDSRIVTVNRYPEGAPAPAGSVMTVTIELAGQHLILLNGGAQYKFTEAVSLFVDCKNQAEVDELWAKLTADGGEEGQCGWLKDKFGLSWQIVPDELSKLLSHPDAETSQRVMQAMLKMKKIIVQDLQAAAAAEN